MNELPRTDWVSALARIKGIVGDAGWLDSEEDMVPYVRDERGFFAGHATAVVKPASTEEVAAVIGICAEAGIPVVPQGGNTGLCGGSVPFEEWQGIVLSLSRMNKVRALDPLNDTVTVDAGCILANVQTIADEVDRLFPLSLGAEGSCQIGGNLSTNAGGVAVLRYGNMRDLVLGLEVVLPDGRIWNGLRGLRKDNTGYDLKQLFIGAEGTLGIITAAVLKLFPKPRNRQTALVALNHPQAAVDLLAKLRAGTGDAITGYEIMPRIGFELAFQHVEGASDPYDQAHPYYQLIELSGQQTDDSLRTGLEEVLSEAISDGVIVDALLAESLQQSDAFWFLREAMPEAQKIEGAVPHDISVPVDRTADFIVEATKVCEANIPGVRCMPFGHIGDGNIHFAVVRPADAEPAKFLARKSEVSHMVNEIVVSMGGSISAEHGIGRLKKEALAHYRSDIELDLMRNIKQAIDPAGLMNPGKIL